MRTWLLCGIFANIFFSMGWAETKSPDPNPFSDCKATSVSFLNHKQHKGEEKHYKTVVFNCQGQDQNGFCALADSQNRDSAVKSCFRSEKDLMAHLDNEWRLRQSDSPKKTNKLFRFEKGAASR